MNEAQPSEPAASPPAHPTTGETVDAAPSTSRDGHEPLAANTATHAPGDPVTASFTGAPAEADELPARIGRYTIRRLLGRGGMGAVYLAHDPELDRPVALKVPRLSGPDAEERFLREARSAAALKHENVCPVHDAGRADGHPYLVMAYIPGPTLTEALKESGPLPVARACEIAVAVARGVAEAHRHGIVHRDLKPGNVLMDARRGGAGEPVVTDFGLALRAGTALPPNLTTAARLAADTDTRLTHTGALLGTPAYMPPEQARGELDRVGPAADVYALGAILFEMLTAAPPFKGNTVSETVTRISTEPAPAPSSVRPDLPAGLDAVVLRALAKEPGARFESMDAFADALAPFAAPPKRRRLFAVALAVVAALLLLAGGVVFYVQTDTGTVEVRLNDPRADVKVSVDGKEITVTDGTRVTKLRAGPHALEVKGADFETQTQLFKITRGDKTVVEIELKPKEKVAGKPPVDPKKPGDPVKPVDPPAPTVAVAPMPHEPPAPDPKRARLAQLLASGKQLVRKGRQLDLEPLVEEALKLDSESPGALALRASLRQVKNDLVGAKADVEAALKLNPETFQALLLKSQFAGIDGKWDEAIAYATCAIRLDPNSGAAWSNRALNYHRKGEPRQAIADATHSIAVSRGFVSPFLTRGAAHASLGDYEKALADYDAAAKIAPTNYSVFVQRSRVYDKMGAKEKSDADWKTAETIAKRPFVRDAEKAFPDPPKPVERKKLTDEERAVFDKALKAARDAWEQRQFDPCRTAIDEAVRIDPTSAPARALRARLFAQTGGGALEEANEAIRLDPSDAWAYTVRGSAKAKAGDGAGAIADHTIALTLAPTNEAAWNNRGYAFTLRKQYHQGLADLNESLRLKPGFSAVYPNRGGCYLYLGEYEKALTDYRAAAASQQTNPRWPMYCYILRVKLGDKEAEQDRELALQRGWNKQVPVPDLPTPFPTVKLDPELPPGETVTVPPPDPKRERLAQLLASGQALIRDNRYLDLEPVVEEALKIDSESPGALALRATLRHAKNDVVGAKSDVEAALKLNPETVQALLMRSFFLGEEGKLDEQIAVTVIAVRVDPKYAAAWNNRANAYFRKKEYRQAIADATEAIKHAENYALPHLTRGAAHAFLGDFPKALADYDAAQKKAPLEPRVLIQRSAVYAQMGEKEKAAADWKAAEELARMPLPLSGRPKFPDPPKPVERKKLTAEEKTDLDAQLAAFHQAWQNGDREACSQATEKACRIDPTSAAAHSARARFLAITKQFKEALTAANEALRLDPNDAWAYSVRGAAKADAKDYAGGIADQTIAVRLDPSIAQAWDARGYANLERGQYQQALADLTEAISLSPSANRYHLRGKCYLRLGEYEKALAEYEASAKLDALDNRVWMMCAALKGRLGDDDGAARDRERALTLGWPKDTGLELPARLPPVKRDPELAP